MPNLIDRALAAIGLKSNALALSPDLVERAMVDAGGSTATSLYRGESPPHKGADEMLALYNTSPWYRATSHQVAKGVASAEWKLFAQRGKGSTKDAPHYVDGAMTRTLRAAPPDRRPRILARAMQAGDVDEIEQHPALAMLDRPNPSMSGFASRMVTQVHLDALGDAFWIIDRDDADMPIELRPIPPTWVKSIPTPESPTFRVKFPKFDGHVFAEDMLWFRELNPSDPYGRGAGLGMAMADELDIDEHAAKHVGAWFHNKGMPEMLVSLKGARPEIVAAAKRKWMNALNGFRKSYQTYFTGAEIDVKRLDTTFKDMALVDIRKSQRDLFVSVFGMPPEKVGILTNSNKSTIDAADLIEAKNVLVPRLELMRAELQRLVEMFDERLVIDYVSPIPGDREFTKGIVSSFSSMFTIDEVRALADMPPLPDDKGNAFLIATGQQYVPDLTALNVAPIYGYHLAAGVTTNNEMRARLGIEPTSEEWGDQRTVGFYAGEYGDTEAGLDDMPALPAGEAAARVTVRHGRQSPVDLRAPPMVRRSAAFLSGKEIKRVLRAIEAKAVSDSLDPVVRALVDKFGEETIQAIDDELHFDADAPAVKEHFKSIANERAAMINTTTKLEARAVLEAWDGDDDSALRADMAAVFDRARVERSQAIATTEGVRSSQFATHEAMDQSGIVAEKEWIAVADGQTREAHLALDGQMVGLDEAYTVTTGKYAGAKAQYPGAFGIGGLDINCRCHSAPTYRIEDKSVGRTVEERAALWHTRDAALRKWEPKIADAARAAFDKQEAAVVDVLAQIID